MIEYFYFVSLLICYIGIIMMHIFAKIELNTSTQIMVRYRTPRHVVCPWRKDSEEPGNEWGE